MQMLASNSIFYPFLDSTSTCALVSRTISIYVTYKQLIPFENPASQRSICQLNIEVAAQTQ